MTKYEWLAEFRTRLTLDLRPDIGDKLANTIALAEWIANGQLDPKLAAQRWAA